MNMIKNFNQTLKYMETTLDSTMDEKKISNLSGYSFAMFSRLFSVLTNITLSEYIRNRKMSEAARLIKNSNTRIIDISMKFGYESPDSFTSAFRNFHGVTPSDIRKGKAYKIATPLQLSMKVTGGRNVNATIQKKDAFLVAGVEHKKIDPKLCSTVWDELYSKYTHEEMSKLGNGTSVGVVFDSESNSEINYMAGYIVDEQTSVRSKSLNLIRIADAEYVIIELEGKVPNCIHEGWQYALEVFMPENGYEHSGAPDFECYFEGDMTSEHYKMELWIPMKRN